MIIIYLSKIVYGEFDYFEELARETSEGTNRMTEKETERERGLFACNIRASQSYLYTS